MRDTLDTAMQEVTAALRERWPELALRAPPTGQRGTPPWCTQLGLELSDAFRTRWLNEYLFLKQNRGPKKNRPTWRDKTVADAAVQSAYTQWMVWRWPLYTGEAAKRKAANDTYDFLFRIHQMYQSLCDPSYELPATSRKEFLRQRAEANRAKKRKLNEMVGALLPTDATPATVDALCASVARALGVAKISHLIDDDLLGVAAAGGA